MIYNIELCKNHWKIQYILYSVLAYFCLFPKSEKHSVTLIPVGDRSIDSSIKPLFDSLILCWFKVHIFWKGHKILWNLHHRFDCYNIGQIYCGDFTKISGLLRMYELYVLCKSCKRETVFVLICRTGRTCKSTKAQFIWPI